MTKLNWNANGERIYGAGVDRGVLYPSTGPGVAWDGLVSVDENISDFNTRVTYMDGQKVQTQVNLGIFAAQISAVTYPLEFEVHDGFAEDGWSGQSRESFNFSYRTMLANEVEGEEYGYEIHLVFNALASPATKDYRTLDDSVSPTTFAWDISTTPEVVADGRPSSHVVINSRQVYPAALAAIENLLYGALENPPTFPTMQELLDLFESFAIFKVVDQGNGIATVSGPDSAVFSTGVDTAMFDWPSVVQLSEDTYRLTSL